MNEQDIIIRPYRPKDLGGVIDLWQASGLVVPHNDPAEDIRAKLAFQPNLFLIGTLKGRIIASVMAGYEGHRGWINYLSVSPDHRRRGIGRLMMGEAEKRLRGLGCPKINLQVRSSNTGVIEFYRKIGFTTDDVISLGKRLS